MLSHTTAIQNVGVVAAPSDRGTATLSRGPRQSGASSVRSLQRIPVHYRAALSLAPAGVGGRMAAAVDAGRHDRLLVCVTRDLHAEGALLHVAAGVPDGARVGSPGRLRIEIGAGETVEFDVDVRHVGAQRLGVRFVT